MSQSSERTVVSGGHVVTPTKTITGGQVAMENGSISDVGASVEGQADVDATGCVVMPGLVDLHGDDIERHLFPRAEDRVPPSTAVSVCDQTTIAAGITTKFHALSFEETPDENRSLELAKSVADSIASFDESGRALAEHKLHLRCELGSADSVTAVCNRLQDDGVGLTSLVNHVPGDGQFDSAEEYARRFDGGTVSTESVSDVVQQRAAVSEHVVDARTNRVLVQANAADVPVAAHDCTDPKTVERYESAGVDICEYPVELEAARKANEVGMCAAMGAPNLVRGESIWDNLSAMRAIRAGVVDVLCSDYRPQSLLSASFVRTGEPLVERVARVTKAPADAVGLSDRGRIEPGARADLLVVDPSSEPRVVRAFVAGQEVYSTTPRPLEE